MQFKTSPSKKVHSKRKRKKAKDKKQPKDESSAVTKSTAGVSDSTDAEFLSVCGYESETDLRTAVEKMPSNEQSPRKP
ncbi:unnamed protein product [Gongylonema pulchrum]|uniref:DUF3008 domain-containing protein n=1 Tax=Gongylonema pulchrum TaxID=637853 RepID=A0A183EVH6_9BILA|nr:unnamed protein product [Gongylonema pulchrum]